MAPTSRPDSFELADYLGVLRRRWWIVLLAVLVGAGAGAAYTEVAPKAYTAGVLIQVNPLPNNANAVAGRTGGKVDMDNEAQIVRSVTVAALAARQFPSALRPAALAKRISVAVPANTTFLQVKCSESRPTVAAECANAFGRAYLDNRRATAADSVSSELTSQNRRIAGLSTKIAQLKAQLVQLPSTSASHVKAELTLTADQDLLNGLTASTDKLVPFLGNLDQPNDAAVGQIATPAVAPTSASSPRVLLLLPSGVLAGLLLGLLAAFFIDFRDRRIHAARDVQRFLDLPVLVNLSTGRSRKSRMLPALAAPRSRAGQAFTELGQYIAAALGDGSHVVFVAGTSVGPGCSVVAANLAATLARTRSEVVLVCADPHGTVTPQLLGISDSRGLAEVLAGSATAADVARRPSEEPRLQVITPGIDTSNVLVHLQYEASRRLLGELRRDARYVIVEVQSLGEDSDAFALAEFADAAVMAIETSLTTRSAAADCLQRLDRLRTSVLGAVVLPAPSARMPSARMPSSRPAGSARPTDSPRTTDSPRLADSPRPTASPRLADSSRTTDSPRLADSSRPTASPRLADSPRTTDSPRPASSARPASSSRIAENPRAAESPRPADSPQPGSSRTTGNPAPAGSRSADTRPADTPRADTPRAAGPRPAASGQEGIPMPSHAAAPPPKSGDERRHAASSAGSLPDSGGNGHARTTKPRPAAGWRASGNGAEIDPADPLGTGSDWPSLPSDWPSLPSDRPGRASDRPSRASDRPSRASDLPSGSADPLGAPSDRPSRASERPSPLADPLSLPSDRPSPRSDRPSPRSDRPSPSLRSDRPSPPSDRPSPPSDRPSPPSDRPSPPSDRPSPPSDRPSPRSDRPSPPSDRPSPSLPSDRPSSAPRRKLNETRPLPRVPGARPTDDLDDPLGYPSPADKIAGG